MESLRCHRSLRRQNLDDFFHVEDKVFVEREETVNYEADFGRKVVECGHLGLKCKYIALLKNSCRKIARCCSSIKD